MTAQIDALRSWSHALFWLSVVLPSLGAVAAVARFYVDRAEKAALSTRSQAELQSTKAAFRSAIQPRTITPIQRDTFLEVLIDPKNVSPKPCINVLVGDTDQETEHFASEFRKLLIEAGYASDKQEILRRPGLRIRDSQGTSDRRIPPIIAAFSSETAEVPPPSMPQFGSVMMMNPTTFSIARGDKSHPRVYRYTEDPNDVLHGVSSVLRFIGIKVDPMSGYRILEPGEIGFLIPKQVE